MSYRPYAFIVAEAQSTNSSISAQLKNDSGSSIAALIPITIDSDGKIKTIDVSNEDDAVKACGVSSASISNGSLGEVVMAGRIENTGLSFNYGDFLYVSKSGGLTNLAPEIGVGGFLANDYVIRVGVVSRNRNTPSNKDLLVRVQIVGRL